MLRVELTPPPPSPQQAGHVRIGYSKLKRWGNQWLVKQREVFRNSLLAEGVTAEHVFYLYDKAGGLLPI
jgi:hypothetical protein